MTNYSFIVYYDMETGRFYSKEEYEQKFANLRDFEKTMRFMPCIRYKSNYKRLPNNP